MSDQVAGGIETWVVTGLRGPCAHDPDPSWHVMVDRLGAEGADPRELRWGALGDHSTRELAQLMTATDLHRGVVVGFRAEASFDWAGSLLGAGLEGVQVGGSVIMIGLHLTTTGFVFKDDASGITVIAAADTKDDAWPPDRATWRVVGVRATRSSAGTTVWRCIVHSEDEDGIMRLLRYSPDASNATFNEVMEALDLGDVAEGVATGEEGAGSVGSWLFGRYFEGVRRGDEVLPIWILPEMQD